MKLIRKTRKEKNKNGRWIYYGIFLCPFDNKEIEKRLDKGIKQKSCGCQTGKEISASKKGKKFTEKHRKNISLSKMGSKRTDISKKKQSSTIKGENHPMYGKKHTEEAILKIKEARKFQINPMEGKNHSKETKEKQSKIKMGSKRTDISKKKQSETNRKSGIFKGKNNPMYGKSGELSPNWNNGSSFEPYAPEFNKELKQFIKNRDLNICQTPNCMNTENFCIHHIDYDKNNNNPNNLITLCNSCHTKTNIKNREYWTEYYLEIINTYL